MNGLSIPERFIFNAKIDQDWLYSLYEYDYPYMTEVFSSSLESLKEELPALINAYESFDLAGLKRGMHKIRPIFGYTGLITHQEQIARFENACGNASSASNLTMQYIETIEHIQEGKNIIQEEYSRLTAFIA